METANAGREVKVKTLRTVWVGCVETGFFIAKKLLAGGVTPAAIVSIDPDMAARAKVSGYKDLGELPCDCPRYYPERYNLSTAKDLEFFTSGKFDCLIILGWQRLIPDEIIRSLQVCGITIHGSAEGLPRGRGRSPLNWAIIEGHREFHLSLLTLEPGADAGRILATTTFDILPSDTIRTLYYKNAIASSRMLLETLPDLAPGMGEVQDESLATYYPKRTPEDGKIVWDQPLRQTDQLIRAVTRPYPGAFTFGKNGKLMIWRAQQFDTRLCSHARPGTVIAVFPDGNFLVACPDGDLIVLDYEGLPPSEGEVLE